VKKTSVVSIVLSLMTSFAYSQNNYIEQNKATIQKITAVFENGSTILQYDYAENIHDGRGITFGFFGLTSGTYDGTLFLKEYQRLNPGNRLVKYIDAFIQIDEMEHTDDGLNACVDGLEKFIDDFRMCIDDRLFMEAQQHTCDMLYWDPAVQIFKELGARLPITLGQIYDTCVQHGVDGCKSICGSTLAEKGRIGIQVAEQEWLECFLQKRILVLRRSGKVWKESVDRVKCYQRFLNDGNSAFLVPFGFEVFGDYYTIE